MGDKQRGGSKMKIEAAERVVVSNRKKAGAVSNRMKIDNHPPAKKPIQTYNFSAIVAALADIVPPSKVAEPRRSRRAKSAPERLVAVTVPVKPKRVVRSKKLSTKPISQSLTKKIADLRVSIEDFNKQLNDPKHTDLEKNTINMFLQETVGELRPLLNIAHEREMAKLEKMMNDM